MSSEAIHPHPDHGEGSPGVDLCPLCGSKISREEFLRIQERIRREVEERSRMEIDRVTALKDREREAAVAARDLQVRDELSEAASQAAAVAAQRAREELAEIRKQEGEQQAEIRESLTNQIQELESSVTQAKTQGEQLANAMAVEVAAAMAARDHAEGALQAAELAEADLRTRIEGELTGHYDAKVQEAVAREREESAELRKRESDEQATLLKALNARIQELAEADLQSRHREQESRCAMAAELVVVTTARDQAQEEVRAAKVAESTLRSTVEAEVSGRYDARIGELARTLERERAEKAEKDRLLREGAEEHARQIREADTRRNAELAKQREILDQDYTLKLLEAQRGITRDREKLQEKVLELERQLQNKTSNELGDITELQVLSDLRNAFPSDVITPIAKGSPGGDILVEVVNNGTACGKILIDAKNRKKWEFEFAKKLQADRQTEKAAYAILV